MSGADEEALRRVGAVLNDKWTLERPLGSGGMGAVYAASHRNGARAAVKLLHPDLARNKEVRERFLREGYAANKVAHPGVVKVLDDDVVSSGPDAGTAYLVMELLEGESLQERLERGEAIGERAFLQIADSVLDVLAAAHGVGVVHRDLKPENLFFARDEGGKTRVKVLDFGLARVQDAQAITTYGLALGTPSFMSPEQAAGKSDLIDGRTDLFSLAATGFRLRTGRRIHEADHIVELVTKMANLPAPPIRTVTPDVSEPYARVIDRALQFKREDRYENAAAMQEDVRRAMVELDTRETMLAVRAPAAPVAAAAPPPAPPAAPPVPPPAPAAAPPPPPRALAPTVPAERLLREREQARAREEKRAKPAKPTKAESSLARVRTWLTESIHLPIKRRSILPWVALLVWGGIGLKLYLEWRDRQEPPSDTVPASSAATVGPSASATADAGAHDAGAPHRAPPHPTRR